MKLQKTNKYTRRITAGLMSAIISASILTGCTANAKVDEVRPTEIVEIEQSPIVKEVEYYLDYYKRDEEIINKELEDYLLKFPDVTWRMNQIYTLIIKDATGEYKVLQIMERLEDDVAHYYDPFTEEHLFDAPNIEKEVQNNLVTNFDSHTITNAISYFDDKEIIEMGLSVYSCLFVSKHINYLRERDNIGYINPSYEPAAILYPKRSETNKLHFSIQDILKAYIRTVPEEFRVTSKDLGVKPNYKEEEKYMDFWKISEDERNSRLEKQEIYKGEKIVNMSTVFTLILKDTDDNYKLMPVLLFDEDGVTKYYNLISGTFLFSTSFLDFSSNYIDPTLLNNHVEYIPYMEDKTVIGLNSAFVMSTFISDNIEEFRTKDGINYMVPDEELFCYLYKDPNENYQYVTDDYDFSVNEIANAYVTVLPEWMQVPTKDLKQGLEKSNEKILVK